MKETHETAVENHCIIPDYSERRLRNSEFMFSVQMRRSRLVLNLNDHPRINPQRVY